VQSQPWVNDFSGLSTVVFRDNSLPCPQMRPSISMVRTSLSSSAMSVSSSHGFTSISSDDFAIIAGSSQKITLCLYKLNFFYSCTIPFTPKYLQLYFFRQFYTCKYELSHTDHRNHVWLPLSAFSALMHKDTTGQSQLRTLFPVKWEASTQWLDIWLPTQGSQIWSLLTHLKLLNSRYELAVLILPAT